VDQQAVEAWWQAFRQASGVDADHHGTFAFGDSPEMADELADLVVDGPKRATPGCCWTASATTSPCPRRATTRWWSTGTACRWR
jgi:uncharacterized protein YhfF